MNFEDEAQLLLQSLQKTISEHEQLLPQARTIDLDSKLGYELCMPLVIKMLENIYTQGHAVPKSSIVDVTSVTANIYGCEPCPKCKSRYRVVLNNNPDFILCEDCGFEEKITQKRIR